MSNSTIQICLELSREALNEERAVAAPGYELGPATPRPPDLDAVGARFVDPVTLIAVVTVAALASRIVSHFLVRDGRGTLIDTRKKPPVVSRLEDVPAGFVVLVKSDGSTETIDSGKTDDSALTGLIEKVLEGAAS
mgnify:FL=1